MRAGSLGRQAVRALDISNDLTFETPEAAFMHGAIDMDGQCEPVGDDGGCLQGPDERAAHDAINPHAVQPTCCINRLTDTGVIERNVAEPLKAALEIPFGLTVPQKQETLIGNHGLAKSFRRACGRASAAAPLGRLVSAQCIISIQPQDFESQPATASMPGLWPSRTKLRTINVPTMPALLAVSRSICANVNNS